MKPFFLCCCLAFVLPAPSPVAPRIHTEQHAAFQDRVQTYRAFQLSDIRKQKRKLQPRISTTGILITLACAALIVGTILLFAYLWPMTGVVLKIVMLWLMLSLTAGFLTIGLLGLVYGRQTERVVHKRAVKRLEKQARKLDFKPEKTWCFPDEQFRVSLAANKNALLLADYGNDKGWLIPKGNIVEIKSDTVSALNAETKYPSGNDAESIILKHTQFIDLPYRPHTQPKGPMHVLDLQCRDLPLRRLTVIYYPGSFGDSTQVIGRELQTLIFDNDF